MDESRRQMTNMSPGEQESAVWRHVTDLLEALETAEYAPEEIDTLTMRQALVRLTGLVHALIQPHGLNEQGRCAACLRADPQDDKRKPCTVFSEAATYLLQPLPVVWWQIYSRQGRTLTLGEVRTWLEGPGVADNTC
jgi:hypothetical protein